ncbi:hypothetical protein TTHERM_01001380 (macronuclear) [Tetrahymena thermophila SB210]|uniref:Uncharacterized protein n=1 Tax=Tetrahymena thermophila (strain SB210) TaxID=312017 RepID=Q24HI6_TETTS|nr:hypothetical protein TTHERM_01001380 [Tetrahymena thermophila SB210]EAS07245.2 hypothetical protein TTHERM_01001380 [Tetrahymena thermophila SB210]|eukprot:XP_001027487.2 hypothetical protein TTHERM_01001380 [Tetrahymena thermophila SB210]
MQVDQDNLYIEEVRQLHFNFDYAKCQERCKVILEEKPYLFQVRTYYGFFLIYDDLNESLKQQLQVYQEAPYYFENTSYLLDNIFSNFQNKGRSLVQTIFKQYNDYQGEKNGFYYICLALIYRIQKDNEKSYEILFSKVNDYDDQPMVQTWFYHQLGCHFLNMTNHGEDEENENVQKSLNFFKKGLELQPRSTMNLQNLGVQYNRIGTQEAYILSVQYYNEALNINPEDHYALCNLSCVLVDLGYHAQSFQIIEMCFKKLKFNFVLQQYLSLLVNQFNMLGIENIDQIFREVCQGIQTLIEIEANNQSQFFIFLYIQILSIQHSIQLKHIDLFEQIVSAFRREDIISLIQLNKFMIEQQLMEDNGEEQTKIVPVQKLTNILIQKELMISQQLLSLIAYKNIIQNNLHFQQSFSHWDLHIDY